MNNNFYRDNQEDRDMLLPNPWTNGNQNNRQHNHPGLGHSISGLTAPSPWYNYFYLDIILI